MGGDARRLGSPFHRADRCAVPRCVAARARLAHPGGSGRRRRAGVPRVGAEIRGAHSRRDRCRTSSGFRPGVDEGAEETQPPGRLRIRHRSAADKGIPLRLSPRALRSRGQRRPRGEARFPLGSPGARMRRGLGARAVGGGRQPHRRRRARSRQAAQGGGAGVLARHAAGLQPPRRAEKRDAIQRLARRAACRRASGSLRVEPHPVFVPGNRIRRHQPLGALALPRRRRDRDDASRAARSRSA